VESRRDKIRKLLADIALIEITQVTFGKTRVMKVLLNDMRRQLLYEQRLELEEIKRPVNVKPSNNNWQDNIVRYIVVGIIIAVIAGLIIFLVTNTTLFSGM